MAGLTLNLKRANKKINSTSNTGNNEKTVTGVVLKAGTDILDPVFIIKNPYAVIPSAINYVQCVELNRYYWINSIVQSSGGTGGSAAFIELHCHVDVLGSWKTLIGDTPCYIKYCSDKSWIQGDHNVVDFRQDDDRLSADIPLVGTRTNILSSTITDALIDPLTASKWNIAVAITLGVMSSGQSSSVIWVLPIDTFSTLFGALLDYTGWNLVNDVSTFFEWAGDKLGGVCLEPAQFIQDIRIVPFVYQNFLKYDFAGFVQIGKVTMDGSGGKTPVAGKRYDTRSEYLMDNYTVDIDISGIGAYNANNDMIKFLRRKKYLKLTLCTPFGNVDISSDSFVETPKLTVRVKVICELTSGDVSVVVLNNWTNEVLGTVTGNVSLNLTHMLSGNGYQQNEIAGAIKGISTIGTSIAGAVLGGPIGAALGGTLGHTIGSLGNSAAGAIQTSVGNGGSIIANTNSWVSYIQQGLTHHETPTPGTSFDKNRLFYVVANIFIPRVCNTRNDYDDYAKIFGYPCNCMATKINDISAQNGAFIQCAHFDIKMGSNTSHDAVMLPQEANEINTYLNSGIYWEVSPSKKEADQKDQPPEINPSK